MPAELVRIAATAFIAGSCLPETKRVKTAAETAGMVTAFSIAASTVHRPSPVSFRAPLDPGQPVVALQGFDEEVESHERMTGPSRQERYTMQTSSTISVV